MNETALTIEFFASTVRSVRAIAVRSAGSDVYALMRPRKSAALRTLVGSLVSAVCIVSVFVSNMPGRAANHQGRHAEPDRPGARSRRGNAVTVGTQSGTDERPPVRSTSASDDRVDRGQSEPQRR